MEWMRCNNCWVKVENKQSQFHLTQCGHVYCDKCIGKAEERCFQCNSVGTISLSLKEPVSPQIAHYFTKPTDLLEKVLQVQQFQETQLTFCLNRSDEHETKYQALKEAYWVSAENLKKVYQKYNKLKMTMVAMQKESKKMAQSNAVYTPSQYQTPPSQMIQPTLSNCHGNYPHNSFVEKNQDKPKKKDELFRVPSSTRVPRSAGYYTASSLSSNSSNYRMNINNSNFSNY